MESTWKPRLIGIFDVISSIVAFTFGAYFMAITLLKLSPMEALFLKQSLVGRIAVALVGGVPFIILGVLALLGGIVALRRKTGRLVLAGSFSASLCFPFLGVPAAIIALLSRGVSIVLRIILLIVFVPIWFIALLILTLLLTGSL